jgi:hypothetical protein
MALNTQYLKADLFKLPEDVRLIGASIFYVYILRHPKTMSPLYVGKGKNKRVFDHFKPSSKNTHLKNKLRKIERIDGSIMIEMFAKNINEPLALEVEIGLVKQFGRLDLKTGVLYNLTDGGDGASGSIKSPETRARMSLARHNMPPEKKEKLTRSFRYKTLEHIQKVAATRVGKTHSAETRQKISDAAKMRRGGRVGIIETIEVRLTRSNAAKEAWLKKKASHA